MLSFDHSRTAAAAGIVLEQGRWCVLEVCVDVPSQRWEPRVLMCVRDPGSVADVVSQEIAREPGLDARLRGCDRRTLRPAAAVMTRGGFRHVIVLEGSELVGILSMRDIVRCWTIDGANCELPPSQATTG